MIDKERSVNGLPNKSVWVPSNLSPLERVIPPELSMTPEALGRFDRIMYALGTCDPRSVALLYGLDREPRLAGAIHDRITAHLAPDTKFLTKTGFYQYHLPPLVRCGLIQEHQVGRRTYFSITEEGERFGKPVAAHLITHVAETNIASGTIFGAENSTSLQKSRSPINRTAVLLALAGQKMQSRDLSRLLGMPVRRINEIATYLQDQGLVDSSDLLMGAENNHLIYRRSDEFNPATYKGTLTAAHLNILNYFTHNPQGDIRTLTRALGLHNSRRVNIALLELAQAGVLVSSAHSTVSLTDKAAQFVHTHLIPMMKICNGDNEVIGEARELQAMIESDSMIATAALEAHNTSSPLKPIAEATDEIIAYIRANGPVQPLTLQKALGIRPVRALKNLVNQGVLRRNRINGRVTFYELPEQELSRPVANGSVDSSHKPLNMIVDGRNAFGQFNVLARSLEAGNYWDELEEDLQRYNGSGSFIDFLYYYGSDNTFALREISSEKGVTLGVHFPKARLLMTYADKLLPRVVDLNLSDEMLLDAAGVVTAFLYDTAPERVKILLGEKFPQNFSVGGE